MLNIQPSTRTSLIKRLLTGSMLAAGLLLSGCASFYVDNSIKDVPATAFRHVDQPKPVQLVFEFQTKGAPNAAATRHLQDQVTEQVKTSGLFANTDATPGPDSAMLNITINNIPLTDNAAGKGFATGLTFGLVGTSVTDGYVCTVSYLPPGQKEPIVKTVKHAIHTTLGNTSAPPQAVKSANVEDAVRTMTRQILANALNDLSNDAQF